MIIAIDKGLEKLKNELTAEGVHVVFFDECRHPIDAYVCNRMNHMDQTCFECVDIRQYVHHGKNYNGAVMINALGKSAAQIKNELYGRINSPIA